ncbi:SAVED domain-containing protein [Mucilaginibacter aquatilis]|uniref:SAVED domain-containing protein n=1 Tax=Mucilaginibacter aquatilis TaxID=1517760 RepID=A0A6I4I8W9_9SPHI|nr:SAVED domain-containing protein [Mucilaginibacter aquatilis]MVN91482.1 SAVED domain-containing protein [Mucilaginibacter aquatilis]
MAKKNKKIEVDNHIVETRPAIKEPDKVRLWVRSGGRCAICNKYLLDLNYDVSIGEMAHIVGWSKADKSPRGDAELALDARNTVNNLMLLCADHHKIIDTKELLEEFTLERLMQHKADHEKRIHHLTDLQIDSESVVLRMLGGIRGATVEVSKENARNVIFNSERKFAMFIDSFDKHGIEIDLKALPEPEENWEGYWSIGQGIIDRSLNPLIEGVVKGQVRHLSVFAMSRIPLLVYLGYQLDDKIPTSLYQKHRGDQETWMWSEETKTETFEVFKLKENASDKIALILSLSGSINPSELPEKILESCNLYEMVPVGTTPNRDILRSKASYENFSKTYHGFLSQLEVSHKSCKQINLFPAVPVTAALACGRGLMRDAQPAIIVYDRSGTIYKPALTVNAK